VIKPFLHWVYRYLWQGYLFVTRPLRALYGHIKKKQRSARQKLVRLSSFTLSSPPKKRSGLFSAGFSSASFSSASFSQAAPSHGGHQHKGNPSGDAAGDYILYAVPRADIVEALNHTLNQTAIPHHPLYGPMHGPMNGPMQPPRVSYGHWHQQARSSAPQSLDAFGTQGPKATSFNVTQADDDGEANYADHPDMVSALADSAYVCERQGRYLEAERLYQQVITLRQQRFGHGDLSVAESLLDLGTLYRAQERYSEAQPLFEQALAIRQHCLRHQHPDVGNSLYQLATLHALQKQYRTAEPLFQQALEISRQEFGTQHPHTQAIYSDFMQMIVAAIESGRFEELLADLPPLDLDNLSKIYSWAKPHWERS
jgi:tetratricopeptide (TPR) repeat protein